jgi:hypothetical protein
LSPAPPLSERNIIYSLIARGTVILVEETLNKSGRKMAGNFATITNKLLPKFPDTNGKASFIYDQCVFRSPRYSLLFALARWRCGNVCGGGGGGGGGFGGVGSPSSSLCVSPLVAHQYRLGTCST